MKKYPLISELNYDQLSHLAFRLDSTGVGAGWIWRHCNLIHGDMTINKLFEAAGKSKHSAKIHARKVINFE